MMSAMTVIPAKTPRPIGSTWSCLPGIWKAACAEGVALALALEALSAAAAAIDAVACAPELAAAAATLVGSGAAI